MKVFLSICAVLSLLVTAYLFGTPKQMYCGSIIEKQTEISFGMTNHYVFVYDSSLQKIQRLPIESEKYPIARVGMYTCQMCRSWQVK